jgi:hypothetical protein
MTLMTQPGAASARSTSGTLPPDVSNDDARPDRFVHGIPTPLQRPGPAWINKPKEEPAQIIRSSVSQTA